MNEEDLEFEQKKIHLETLRHIILSRYNIVFTIPMLTAAILVIATFNPKILYLSLSETKILVVILLAIIPIALIDYSLKLSRDANHVMAILKLQKSQEMKKGFFKKLLDGSSYIYVLIVTLVIIYVIFSTIRSI